MKPPTAFAALLFMLGVVTLPVEGASEWCRPTYQDNSPSAHDITKMCLKKALHIAIDSSFKGSRDEHERETQFWCHIMNSPAFFSDENSGISQLKDTIRKIAKSGHLAAYVESQIDSCNYDPKMFNLDIVDAWKLGIWPRS